MITHLPTFLHPRSTCLRLWEGGGGGISGKGSSDTFIGAQANANSPLGVSEGLFSRHRLEILE